MRRASNARAVTRLSESRSTEPSSVVDRAAMAENAPERERLMVRNERTAPSWWRRRGLSAVGVPLLAVGFCLLLAPLAYGHGIPEAQRQAIIEGGNLSYLWLGASHMLTGYDHLLFLLGVIFLLTGFWQVVSFITAFTLGHSITLLAATLAGFDANYFLIDAVIGLSVIYIGFQNLDGFRRYLKVEPPNLLVMVFAFGLIHGLGLSTRLQQLPLPETGLVWRILSFNLGIELGQIAALVVILAVIAGWRRLGSWAVFARLVNAGLILAGGFFFATQMHGFSHAVYTDDFAFSDDLHQHAHKEIAAASAWIDSAEAAAIAEFLLEGLSAEGAVRKTWVGATVASVQADVRQGDLAWAVVFENDDGGAARLRLYLTLAGDYIAAVEDDS